MWPPRMRPAVPANGRLRWTRRTALGLWSRSIGLLSLLATGAIALGAAFQGIADAGKETLLGLALVAALPALWIGLTKLAEKRFLSRPPKGFLAAALGIDFGGIALVAAAVVLLQSQAVNAGALMTAGGFLEGCGTVLLLGWFVGVVVAKPVGDHMHSL